jgi:putative transposase
LGWVKMTEDLRYQGKILSAKIFKQGGKWFASIAVELNQPEKLHPKTGLSVGIDLGVSSLATLSNGEVVPSSAPLKKQLAKLRRLAKSFSRKRKVVKTEKSENQALSFALQNIMLEKQSSSSHI